jgi:DNA repair protein RadC
VHPREIFAPAIELRAASVILIHCHPSGDTKPSKQDIEITKRLSEVGEIMGIKVLDHVIIGEDYFSFVDQEMMPILPVS